MNIRLNIRSFPRIAAMAVALSTSGALAQAGAAEPSAAATPTGTDVLRLEAGTWDADITFPSQEAGKPDGKAKGVQVNRLRSGGQWIINEFSVDGTPYEGTGIWGYNRATDRYSGIWVDNNNQQIRFDDGRWDPKTQTMTWVADVLQSNGVHLRLLNTSEYRGNTRTFTSAALTRKGEIPLVRIVFTKRAETATTSTPGAAAKR